MRPFRAAWRAEIGEGVIVGGKVWLPGAGSVVLGDGVELRSARAPIELRAHAGGRIVIGDHVILDGGCSIEATLRVEIAPRCHIGAFCKILDNHFHRVTGDRHERPESAPVTLGEGVILGAHTIILPGAVIGAGARIGPNQVVSGHVPAGARVAQG